MTCNCELAKPNKTFANTHSIIQLYNHAWGVCIHAAEKKETFPISISLKLSHEVFATLKTLALRILDGSPKMGIQGSQGKISLMFELMREGLEKVSDLGKGPGKKVEDLEKAEAFSYLKLTLSSELKTVAFGLTASQLDDFFT